MLKDRPVPPGLAPFWNGTVGTFATLSNPPIPEEMKERHRMYSLLLMSLIVTQWNGNKHGELGDYGIWRTAQQLAVLPTGQKLYRGGTYLGHNIAALAVDGEGRIMDFDFNHNDIFDSSVEHAESRLVRRLFALTQVYDPWVSRRGGSSNGDTKMCRRDLRPRQNHHLFATAIDTNSKLAIHPAPYSTLLKDVTIYTSLESCAQCSGIMCLASVKEIVYLQWDQGQFLIGNMMWQATTTQASGFVAPRPIRGDEFDFEYFAALNDANDDFSGRLNDNPFYKDSNGNVKKMPSVTSFLCTDKAYGIFQAANNELLSWKTCKFPEYRPTASAFSNEEVLSQVQDYLSWLLEFNKLQINNRGTSHRV